MWEFHPLQALGNLAERKPTALPAPLLHFSLFSFRNNLADASDIRRSGGGRATFHHKASDLDSSYQLDIKNHQNKRKLAKLVPARVFPVWITAVAHSWAEHQAVATSINLVPWAPGVPELTRW